MSILIPILIVFHILVCLLMVLVVLMQRPRSEGLGAAFGGGMADNLFGAQTTHVLQRFTVWLGGGFFALTLLLAILYARTSTSATPIQLELLADPPAAETAPFVPEVETVTTETVVVETPDSAAPEAAQATEAAEETPSILATPTPGLFPTPPPVSNEAP